MKKLFVYDRLTRLLRGTNDARGALFYIDVGNFQVINDIYGYEVSSQVMEQIAYRLKKYRLDNIYHDKRVSRIASNEFLVFCTDIEDENTACDLASRILEEFDVPIIHDDKKFYISLSIGIALYPEHGSDIENLIEHANLALNRAKNSNKNSFKVYERDMSRDIAAAATLKRNLKDAVKENQFRLHYHPQVDLISKEIVSLEVLTRWNHPQQGLIYPNDFIHIAEETRFIIPMGDFVLRTACQQLKQWHDDGFSKYNISINISPIQLQQRHFVENMQDILHDTGLDPSYIELEITEHSLIRYMEQAIDVLEKLSDMGIKISLDDFGTGYSSLNYLKKLPVDIIKMDKTFIDNIEDEVDRAIVKAIIVMGHDMDLCITAEGVETEQQLEILRGLGCDRAQGFLFGKPMPSTQIEKKINGIDQQMKAL